MAQNENGSPSNGCSNIAFKSTNVKHMMVLEEKSEDHRSQRDSSSGDQNSIAVWSVVEIFKYGPQYWTWLSAPMALVCVFLLKYSIYGFPLFSLTQNLRQLIHQKKENL